MSHFNFTNKGFRGFTLIELLVVIAIIGLLGTIISGPINNARNKARDAKKVADVKNLQAALAQYADTVGYFPANLGLLAPSYIDAVPRNTLSTFTPKADKYMYVTYADANGIFGYHLGVKLSVTGNPALDNDSDCTQNTPTAPVVPCVPAVTTIATPAWSANAGDPGAASTNSNAATSDFTSASVNDMASTTCTSALNTCIYDVRGTI